MRRLFNIIGIAWHWFRSHTFARYHLLDMRSPKNGYRYGYMDRSDIMLFANFKLLVEYVELEDALNFIDWDPDDDDFPSKEWVDETRHAGKEIRELYKWWTVERPNLVKASEVAPVKLSMTLDEQIKKMDDINLLRLIKIRGHLWT